MSGNNADLTSFPFTEEELIYIVSQYPDAIKLIQSPSESIQLAAVSRNSAAIQYIKNPSEAVQLAAIISQDSLAMQSVPRNLIQRVNDVSGQHKIVR